MTNWGNIKDEFESTNITMKELAKKHGINSSTLRSRKNREGWSKDEPSNATKSSVATQRNKQRIKRESVATPKEVESVIKNDELNDQQKLFCLYVAKGNSDLFSYMKAYKTSYINAQRNAWKQRKNKEIEAEITRLKTKAFTEEFLTMPDLVAQMKLVAMADITDYLDMGTEEVIGDDGKTYTVNRIYLRDGTEIDGSLVESVTQGRDGVKVQLVNKQFALKWLADYYKEVDGLGGMGDVLIVDEWSDGNDEAEA